MRQAVMIQPGKIIFNDIPVPDINDNEVLIRIKRIGVCGSDIHVYHGAHPYTTYPVVQGHEVSGVIEKTGSLIKHFEPGDQVVFMPQVTCGECYPCRHGLYHICDHLKVMGFQTSGAAQDYFPINVDKVLKVPESISLDEAAMIEPIAVAVHAVRRAGGVLGKKVMVLGAGTIGNLVGQCALAGGAKDVLITDIQAYKIKQAVLCGFKNTLNSRDQDLAEGILKTFGQDKADVILECVGHQDTIDQAISLARKGSTVVIVGVFAQKPVVDVGLIQDRELNILGTLMYQKEDYEKAIEYVSQKKLNLSTLITHRFSFDQYREAYRAIENSHGEYMKVMIEV